MQGNAFTVQFPLQGRAVVQLTGFGLGGGVGGALDTRYVNLTDNQIVHGNKAFVGNTTMTGSFTLNNNTFLYSAGNVGLMHMYNIGQIPSILMGFNYGNDAILYSVSSNDNYTPTALDIVGAPLLLNPYAPGYGGFVGIGNTAPQSMLDVSGTITAPVIQANGTLAVTGTLNSNNTIFADNIGGNVGRLRVTSLGNQSGFLMLTYDYAGNPSIYSIWTGDGYSPAPLLIYSNNLSLYGGPVGINTITPRSLLDVSGVISAQDVQVSGLSMRTGFITTSQTGKFVASGGSGIFSGVQVVNASFNYGITPSGVGQFAGIKVGTFVMTGASGYLAQISSGIGATYGVILVSGNGITGQLPDLTAPSFINNAPSYTFKMIVNGTGIISGYNANQLIDGQPRVGLSGIYKYIQLQPYSSGWWIIGQN